MSEGKKYAGEPNHSERRREGYNNPDMLDAAKYAGEHLKMETIFLAYGPTRFAKLNSYDDSDPNSAFRDDGQYKQHIVTPELYAAVIAIADAWNIPGRAPGYHNEMKNQLKIKCRHLGGPSRPLPSY